MISLENGSFEEKLKRFRLFLMEKVSWEVGREVGKCEHSGFYLNFYLNH